MRVDAVYRQDVVTAGPYETLADAASRMQCSEVGALAVFEQRILCGIVTEREFYGVYDLADGLVVRYRGFASREAAEAALRE